MWAGRFAAPIEEDEVARGVRALYAFELQTSFFGDRLVGMRRLRDVDPEYGREVMLAPNRAGAPRSSSAAKDACPFCVCTHDDERRLIWRNYWVRANAFPYVPADSRHVLIMPTEHRPQSCSSRLLADMIDFQRALSSERPATLHYNGIAGNSQPHLHWQATLETTPLQRAIDRDMIALEVVKTEEDGRVDSFDQGPFAGVLIRGSRSTVVRETMALISMIERDPRTSIDGQGTYNLLLLHPTKQDPVRLVVFPRRASSLLAEAEAKAPYRFGCFELAGILTVPKNGISPEFIALTAGAARRTLMSPRELFSGIAKASNNR